LALSSSAMAASTSPKKKPEPVDLAAQAIPVSKETRIVRYTYSPDVIFRIFTRSNLHTHIELGEDEGLKEKPVLGENLEWRALRRPTKLIH